LFEQTKSTPAPSRRQKSRRQGISNKVSKS
jgi:hypothetical protein